MLISIITPCYNCADFIRETFDTVKKQSHADWEWVCVEDQSSDETYELLKQFATKDPRVKVFQNKENSGAAVTRNRALDEASGEYIAFLDSDDLWEECKLASQLDFMQENSLKFSHHNYLMVDRAGEKIKEMLISKSIQTKDLLKFNPFATSSIMICKSVADQVRFRVHLRRRQDYLYWYECLQLAHRTLGLSEFLSSYRQAGESSLSSNKKNMALIQWKLLGEEFDLNIFERGYYFGCYAVHGVKKYFL